MFNLKHFFLILLTVCLILSSFLLREFIHLNFFKYKSIKILSFLVFFTLSYFIYANNNNNNINHNIKEDQEEVEEKKEEESMLQEPSIQIKNTTSTPNTVTKHLNGSAVVESTDLAKTLTDVPPVYEKLKPDSIKTAESVVVSPVLPLAPKQFTSQLSQSHAASSPNQASLDKAVSPSLNVSLSNAQDDNRSLSSNEFTNDQALSLSYPVQYKSTIAPRQTVISRRSNNDRMPAVNQSKFSSSSFFKS